MKTLVSTKFALALLICLLSSAFAFADSARAALTPVKANRHHAQRHHAHKAAKHHTPKRRRHTV
jgi:hypothetical protein